MQKLEADFMLLMHNVWWSSQPMGKEWLDISAPENHNDDIEEKTSSFITGFTEYSSAVGNFFLYK